VASSLYWQHITPSSQYPQLELTALRSNKYSGYTTITHPFHPLKNSRLQILSTKRFNNKDILSLKTLTGSIVAIPRDWTDKADPNPYETLTNFSPILSFSHLKQLAELVRDLNQTFNKKKIDR
jgi:Family of unknown function (DUF5372)